MTSALKKNVIITELAQVKLAEQAGVKRSYRVGDTILRPGDIVKGLRVIVSGLVTISTLTLSGRTLIIGHLYPGDMMGQDHIFNPDMDVDYYFTAKDQTSVMVVPFNLIDGAVMLEVCRGAIRDLAHARRRVIDTCSLPMEGRVLNLVVSLAKSPEGITYPGGIAVKASRISISQILGCSREMVGKTLKKLSEEGVLDVKGKMMYVPTLTLESPSGYMQY